MNAALTNSFARQKDLVAPRATQLCEEASRLLPEKNNPEVIIADLRQVLLMALAAEEMGKLQAAELLSTQEMTPERICSIIISRREQNPFIKSIDEVKSVGATWSSLSSPKEAKNLSWLTEIKGAQGISQAIEIVRKKRTDMDHVYLDFFCGRSSSNKTSDKSSNLGLSVMVAFAVGERQIDRSFFLPPLGVEMDGSKISRVWHPLLKLK